MVQHESAFRISMPCKAWVIVKEVSDPSPNANRRVVAGDQALHGKTSGFIGCGSQGIPTAVARRVEGREGLGLPRVVAACALGRPADFTHGSVMLPRLLTIHARVRGGLAGKTT